MTAWVKESGAGEASGCLGRRVGLRGGRAGVLGPGRGSDRGWCPPNPQRGRSCPRHEAAAGAGVWEGIHSARLQQWHTLPVPDQVPRGAGEPGTHPGTSHLRWGEGGRPPVEGGGGRAESRAAACLAALVRGGQGRGVGRRCTEGAPKRDLVFGGGGVRPSLRVG